MNSTPKLLVFIRSVSSPLRHYRIELIMGEKAIKIIKLLQRLSSGSRCAVDLIDNLGLSTKRNIMTWIRTLLDVNDKNIDNKDIKNNLEYLVNDFADNMKTRMRMKGKCAIGFVWSNNIILAHTSCGDESLIDKLEIEKRLIDYDNIIRFIHVYREDDIIKVKYYERIMSETFKEWLGLRDTGKVYYEFRGLFEITTEVHGMEIKISLTDKDLGEILAGKSSIIRVKDNSLIFVDPITVVDVKMIKYGRMVLKNLNEAKEKVKMISLGIDKLYKVFQSLFFQLKMFHKLTGLEDIDKITLFHENGKEVIVKETPLSHLFSVFADGLRIKVSEDYIEKIVAKFLNNEEVLLVFLSNADLKDKILLDPALTIGNLKVYNDVKISENLKGLINYYTKAELPLNIKYIIGAIILSQIAVELQRIEIYKPMAYFFSKLFIKILDKVIELLKSKGYVGIKEDKIIELKSRDYIVGDNEEIVERLSNDIIKKLQESNVKIYILGIDESTRKIEGINKYRFKDDRLKNIIGELERKLKEKGLQTELDIYPLEINDTEIILLLIVKKNEIPQREIYGGILSFYT